MSHPKMSPLASAASRSTTRAGRSSARGRRAAAAGRAAHRGLGTVHEALLHRRQTLNQGQHLVDLALRCVPTSNRRRERVARCGDAIFQCHEHVDGIATARTATTATARSGRNGRQWRGSGRGDLQHTGGTTAARRAMHPSGTADRDGLSQHGSTDETGCEEDHGDPSREVEVLHFSVVDLHERKNRTSFGSRLKTLG